MAGPSATRPDATDGLAARLERVEIQRAASSVPGRDIVQVRGRASVTLHSGEGFLVPPRTPHNALSTYFVQAEEPLAILTQ